ncbi:MAG: PspC domain-containing protein [Thermoanaerobaculales bacterium]
MAATTQKCRRCLRDLPPDVCFCPVCGARADGEPRKLHRRRDHEKLAGVCAGLADYFDMDPTVMRVLYVVATFFTGVLPGLMLYIILAFVIPAE